MANFIHLDKIKIPTTGPSESTDLEEHFKKYGGWTDLGKPESEGSVLSPAKVTITSTNLQRKYVKVQYRESGERFWIDVLAHDEKTGGLYGLVANELVATPLDFWHPVSLHIFHVWEVRDRPEHTGVKPGDENTVQLVPSDLPPNEEYVGEEITDAGGLNPGHEQVMLKIDEDIEFEVDKGMEHLIEACWLWGGPTIFSCEKNVDGKAWIQFLNPLCADDFLTRLFEDNDVYCDGNKIDPADWEWETFEHGGQHNVTVYFPPELIECLTDALWRLHQPDRGEMISELLPEVKEEVQRLLAEIEKDEEEDD